MKLRLLRSERIDRGYQCVTELCTEALNKALLTRTFIMSSPLSSRATSSGPSEIDVPAELVLPILEYALSEMPCQSDLRFLLLSKDIYVL
jgi:hypothetical protein